MADTSATVTDAADAVKSTANELTEIAQDNGSTIEAKTGDAKQVIKDGASKYSAQAADKVRAFADDGKARAGAALDQVAQLLNDAAGQVDDKLGSQYGSYARTAADSVTSFSEQVKAKDVDQLVDEARELVKKSPGVAVGIAAALGFVVARLIQSGVDANTKA